MQLSFHRRFRPAAVFTFLSLFLALAFQNFSTVQSGDDDILFSTVVMIANMQKSSPTQSVTIAQAIENQILSIWNLPENAGAKTKMAWYLCGGPQGAPLAMIGALTSFAGMAGTQIAMQDQTFKKNLYNYVQVSLYQNVLNFARGSSGQIPPSLKNECSGIPPASWNNSIFNFTVNKLATWLASNLPPNYQYFLAHQLPDSTYSIISLPLDPSQLFQAPNDPGKVLIVTSLANQPDLLTRGVDFITLAGENIRTGANALYDSYFGSPNPW